MKIISNFKDYYDCCQKGDTNKSLIYYRHTEEIWYNNANHYEGKINPKISNEDMIQAKGFDLKYSFRKPKKEKFAR